MTATARSPWPALAVALLAFGAWGWIHRPKLSTFEAEGDVEDTGERDETGPSEPPVFPYSAQARALLGGLEPGDGLSDGWIVERVEGPLPDGRIKVIAQRDTTSFAVWLVPVGQSEHPPPIASERWDLFYDRPNPPWETIAAQQQIAVLEQLAARARANEDRDDAR